MAVFENTDKMYTVLGSLFNKLVKDPAVGPQFVQAEIVIKFTIDNPSGEIWLSPGNGGEVICGPSTLAPTIEMSLSGDTCHKFWLQEVSMPIALAKGLIKAKGPLPKVLKLLPLLKPAYESYPAIAKEHGLKIEGK
ncbi:MAG TPA: hypothetical protein PK307_17640 [Spirochaetota bacterium]|nr:hypothetical protein [Spirochaetota bacterium]HOD14277.1 hypothetical protein [Spirochaetota bacterium]HPG49275.1 hypothetical protein [Spirochaetota bacterium]HPN11082.1 hypothetical protein [Spirochaetota bacterium]HQL84025.1 hypothetical protein [Spirochaetota bacterium]